MEKCWGRSDFRTQNKPIPKSLNLKDAGILSYTKQLLGSSAVTESIPIFY